jgi:hypothetical protein
VTLMLRPEDASVATAAPAGGGNALAGTVLRASMLGATVNIGVAVGETVVSVIAPHSIVPPQVGSAVFVTWNTAAGLLFSEP